MDGRIDVTDQEVESLEHRVVDLEGKLVKLAALEAAFNHFTNEHWISFQAVVISLHDSLCWTCRGDGEPLPDEVQSSSAPPFLSIAIPVPPPCSGQRPATPGPPPLSPVTDDDSSVIPDSSIDSSPNLFYVERRMFRVAQGPDELVWTDEERAAVRKLDLSQLCFSLNFYFLMFLRLFPSMFPLLTYSQSFLSLIC